MKRLLPLFTLLAASACGPHYDGLELTLFTEPPVPVRISSDEVEMPVGIAVAVDAKPLSSARFGYYEDDPFELTSQDPGILRIEHTETGRRFVFIAVSPGETCIDVEVVREDQGCIPATVLAAPN